MNIFGVLRFCRYFIGGHYNIGLYFGVNSMHFRVFFKVNGDFFVVANISIFLGCLKFLKFLGVNGRCRAQAYV